MKFLKRDVPTVVLCVTALFFLVKGGLLATHNYGSYDFITVYCGSRCLIEGCNPYDPSQLQQQFSRAGGHENESRGFEAYPPVYPPSTLVAFTPLARIGFRAARFLWFLLNGSLFLVAIGLVLSLNPLSQRWLASLFACLILLNSIVLLHSGQPGIFAIATLMISCTLFLRERYLAIASLLLMLSLVVKPQIGLFVAIFFFIRRSHRRYVSAAIIGALAFLLTGAMVLNRRPSSSEWLSDLRTNVATSLTPGHINDPNEPGSTEINLQGATSLMFANAKMSDAVSYGIFAILFAIWGVGVWRMHSDPEGHIVLLGALLVLSLLPAYHRYYDAAILFLTLPAILVIFRKSRYWGAVIVGLTALSSTLVSGRLVTWIHLHAPSVRLDTLEHKPLFILLLRQQNFELLLLACLYLVVIFKILPSTSSAKQPSPSTVHLSPAST